MSSIDSASSVRVGVSGERRPIWISGFHVVRVRAKLQALVISCGGKTPPRTYCMQEFANYNRVIDTVWLPYKVLVNEGFCLRDVALF